MTGCEPAGGNGTPGLVETVLGDTSWVALVVNVEGEEVEPGPERGEEKYADKRAKCGCHSDVKRRGGKMAGDGEGDVGVDDEFEVIAGKEVDSTEVIGQVKAWTLRGSRKTWPTRLLGRGAIRR